jgi:hypothetical protein
MYNRTIYGEITNPPTCVTQLLIDAERAGCWETGIASDRKQRGTAINTAIYGFNDDLAIVQVREAQFRPGRFTKVRKDYYLLGRVEDGTIFAHAIDSPLRSKLAMADPEYCVDYALAKIWNCKIDELKDIIRQGDIALIPVLKIPSTAQPVEAQTLRETHRVEGELYQDGDTLYCKRGTKIVHTKGEHKTIKAKSGLYRIQPGYRAEVWGFSAPTAD